jgi:protein-S-isoprenylcysteine O-methyltransferase Ste14
LILHDQTRRTQTDVAGRRSRLCDRPAARAACVFGPVGRIGWRPGWFFIASLAASFALSVLVIALVKPVILRARSRFQKGTQTWDLVLLAAMLPVMVLEIPAGTLDSGRMHWSLVPTAMVGLGHVLILAAIAGTAWAQAVNPFFEPGVRIHQERGQRVIPTGPYALVRHRGCCSAIALCTGIALAPASWWAVVPAAIASALLVLRTVWEDRLLRTELAGYDGYARRIRFRLVPGLW